MPDLTRAAAWLRDLASLPRRVAEIHAQVCAGPAEPPDPDPPAEPNT